MDFNSKWDEKTKQNPEFWELWLYVAGRTPKSLETFANLKGICKKHLHGKCHVKVIDLKEKPECAKEDQILAIPTLVRKFPENSKRVVGNLSNTEKVLKGLDICY